MATSPTTSSVRNSSRSRLAQLARYVVARSAHGGPRMPRRDASSARKGCPLVCSWKRQQGTNKHSVCVCVCGLRVPSTRASFRASLMAQVVQGGPRGAHPFGERGGGARRISTYSRSLCVSTCCLRACVFVCRLWNRSVCLLMTKVNTRNLHFALCSGPEPAVSDVSDDMTVASSQIGVPEQ